MSLQTELDAAKAEVARIEAEIKQLPETLIGKTEKELAIIYHSIAKYFRWNVPAIAIEAEPVAVATPEEPVAPVEPVSP